MDNKPVVFFFFAFTSMAIISFVVEGQSAFAATRLTTAIDLEDTSITVTTTSGFLDSDCLFLSNEVVCYSSKTATTFDGLTRGDRDTRAISHAAGTRTYNDASGLLNQVLGFNVQQTLSRAGAIQAVVQLPFALLKAFARVITWDFSYLEGPAVYIKYIILYPLSIGFTVSLVQMTLQTFRSLFVPRFF